MKTANAKAECIGGQWYCILPGWDVYDGISGRKVETVPDERIPAEDEAQARAIVDYYDEQDRQTASANRAGLAGMIGDCQPVFDGDW